MNKWPRKRSSGGLVILNRYILFVCFPKNLVFRFKWDVMDVFVEFLFVSFTKLFFVLWCCFVGVEGMVVMGFTPKFTMIFTIEFTDCLVPQIQISIIFPMKLKLVQSSFMPEIMTGLHLLWLQHLYILIILQCTPVARCLTHDKLVKRMYSTDPLMIRLGVEVLGDHDDSVIKGVLGIYGDIFGELFIWWQDFEDVE